MQEDRCFCNLILKNKMNRMIKISVGVERKKKKKEVVACYLKRVGRAYQYISIGKRGNPARDRGVEEVREQKRN